MARENVATMKPTTEDDDDLAIYEAATRSCPQRDQELFDDIPAAVAVTRDDGFSGLEVLWCPFCSGHHHHSPGYGTRYSHCGRGEYVLVAPYGALIGE
jgi:hypothetical protein